MKQKLELWLPFENAVISQVFAGNANPFYAEHGLKGHTGVDYGADWGLPIPNTVEEAYCYSVTNRDHPDPTKYRAVYTIVETSTGCYEVSYGHCEVILAEVGRTYRPGEYLALVGNTGDVYSNGGAVSKEARLAGSRAGAHLHYQVRKVIKVTKTSPHKQYLSDGNGLLKKDGVYYEVDNYENGYNGCIDPKPFFNGKLAITHDAELVKENQLTLLQRVLKLLQSKKK